MAVPACMVTRHCFSGGLRDPLKSHLSALFHWQPSNSQGLASLPEYEYLLREYQACTYPLWYFVP